MKLSTNRKQLITALQLATSVTPKKATMPVLANALLAATKGKLTLSATDLDRALTLTLDADGARPGSICLPAKELLDRVRMMPGDVVTIDDETIRAPGTKRRFKLYSVPGEEFPKLPEPSEGAYTHTLPGDDLQRMIDAVQPAVSTEESRLHLHSMLLEINCSSVLAVATDGHRLALKGQKAEGDVKSLLLPLGSLAALKSLAGDGDVLITSDAAWTFAEVNGARFAVKTPNVTFPPYMQVLPKSQARSATVARDVLADAIRAVAVAASERTGGLRFAFAPGAVTISTESPDSGEASDTVELEYDGPETVIGLSARYMLDALAACETDEVTVGFDGELDPVVVRGGEYVGCVMPMRI